MAFRHCSAYEAPYGRHARVPWVQGFTWGPGPACLDLRPAGRGRLAPRSEPLRAGARCRRRTQALHQVPVAPSCVHLYIALKASDACVVAVVPLPASRERSLAQDARCGAA